MTAASIVRFRALIDGMPLPERASRDALGTLPIRAARWCDAITSASSYGWWLYPPIDFDLLFDGERIWWSCMTAFDGWLSLEAAQYPHFADAFDAAAPAEARGYSPPFLTALPEPGLIQIWTGLLTRTTPGWSLLLRAPANIPGIVGATPFEGIVEADLWAGPIFTNFRLTRTNEPIIFRRNMPFVQAVPVPQLAYSDSFLDKMEMTTGLAELDEAEWRGWIRDVVEPNRDTGQRTGRYATIVRRRRKAIPPTARCPFYVSTSHHNTQADSTSEPAP